jgi:tetratricopeptide (TPR) repeat protein
MNRKQRRITQAKDKHKSALHFNSKSYTLEEICSLAQKEQHRGNSKLALDIYTLLLAKGYRSAELYNNIGNAFEALQRLEEALGSYEKALLLKPDYSEVYNNRGNTLQSLKRFNEALESYARAIILKPGYADAHYNLGNTLQELRRFDEALVHYDRAIALHPGYAYAHNNRGVTLQKMKRYDEALASCTRAVALKPDYADAYQNMGVALVNKGSMREAEKMFCKALALNPHFSNAVFSLTNMRKNSNADNADIENIRELLAKPDITWSDKEYLYFSLGKIYDDCERYDEAFECYQQANRICAMRIVYNADKTAEFTKDSKEVFTKEFLAQPYAFASGSPMPVFIVGMPRSGTTLMASILSNHPSIRTAGELRTISALTARLPELIGNAPSYPQAVKHMTPATASRMIVDYEAHLKHDAGGEAPFIIDKHPLNFKHLGFIAMLFPNATVIHCTRDPMDTVLSNYFQRFYPDYDYAFDLQNIGHFYGEYTKMMEHWRSVLPLKMIDVSYEDMVLRTEKLARRTLDFLGLQWDERCLAPHTNPCAVETASNWQVRQPIYTQSVERWRHYEKNLTPLKAVLQL